MLLILITSYPACYLLPPYKVRGTCTVGVNDSPYVYPLNLFLYTPSLNPIIVNLNLSDNHQSTVPYREGF